MDKIDKDAILAARKWNERYKNGDFSNFAPVRKLLSNNTHLLPSSGRVLEIAGGIGIASDFLQKHGLMVFQIDIALNGLLRSRMNNVDVLHIAADANRLPFSNQTFDMICNFYYFDRKVIPYLITMLHPGGLFFIETLTVDMLKIHPEISEEYLLQPGELRSLFDRFEILYFFEGWTKSDHGKDKSISSMIAKKPLTGI